MFFNLWQQCIIITCECKIPMKKYKKSFFFFFQRLFPKIKGGISCVNGEIQKRVFLGMIPGWVFVGLCLLVPCPPILPCSPSSPRLFRCNYKDRKNKRKSFFRRAFEQRRALRSFSIRLITCKPKIYFPPIKNDDLQVWSFSKAVTSHLLWLPENCISC